MKIKKITIILAIILTFGLMLVLTFLEFKNYASLTNNFASSIIEKIETNYPNISTEEIIELVNAKEYDASSQILTSYGISSNDLSVLSSFETAFYQSVYLNIVLFGIVVFILLLSLYFYNRKQKKELNFIINYLKELNRGNYDLQIDLNSEGKLSILKNEIYTTTIMLKEQMEKEMQDKINLKDSLTNISHQLKTPLTSISLLVDNLTDSKITKETQQEFLKDIKNQVESINYLIIALLKLSRFDANVVIFKKEEINLKSLLFAVLKHVDIIRDLKNINIHVNGANSITFNGDYHWEFEALSNILKNCLEYTPNNKCIYISYKENNVYVELSIADEGNGVPNEELKHIFERFYKGTNSTNNSFGIGLSLAKEIINKDNGTIKVTSTIGKGTIFKVRYYK